MSPSNKLRRNNHNYNLRKKRNKAFDIVRNPILDSHSPFKACTDCGIRHKKSKLVHPKSRIRLDRELCQEINIKMAENNNIPSLRIPTNENIQNDIRRAHNLRIDQSSHEFVGFDNESRSERQGRSRETEDLDRKIASTVEKAITESHKQITAQMVEMMNSLMRNLQLNQVPTNTATPIENDDRQGRIPRMSTNNPMSNPTGRGNINTDRPSAHEQANSSLNVSTSTRILNSNEVSKWNLRFEKGTSAKEFLNIVKIQWEVSGYSWEQVYYNFHYFLVGQKEKIRWYYQYLGANRQANWAEFSRAFKRRFDTFETDRQITTRMDQRKQGINEPFLNFLEDMEQLNASLENPKNEQALIEFLRDNVNCYMRPYIWMKYANNLEEFITLCSDAELQIKKDKYRPAYQGRVSEVQYLETENNPDESIDAFVKTHHQKENYELECWNCDGKGHFSRNCPSEVRVIHCFRCGIKGVTTPSCPKCGNNKGNSNRIVN